MCTNHEQKKQKILKFMFFCQVIERLNLLLRTAGVALHAGDSGPCLVTVVNSSRIQADITRDTRSITGDKMDLE